MHKVLTRTAASLALALAALMPMSGVASADGGHGAGVITGQSSFTNIGGPYGITHVDGRFFAAGV